MAERSTPDPHAPRSLVKVQQVWKLFSGVPVLSGVSLELRPGEIHALLGGNGAGKSTLMKLIAGLYRPDRGQISVAGEVLARATPALAHRLGVYLVPQEPLLFPNLSVWENVTLRLPRESGQQERLTQLMVRLDLKLDLRLPARYLDVAQQQLVEILRGLMRRAQVLILDEPTSALTPKESHLLFDRLRRLTAEGVGLFFISHKLGEVRDLCDTLSVLRDGVIVLQGDTASFSDDQIVAAMTNQTVARADAPRSHRFPAPHPVMKLDNLSGEGFGPVSLALRSGEVLGLAGVVGSGRTELAETVVGLRRRAAGQLSVSGQPTTFVTPHAAIEAGVVYLTEDRQNQGLFQEASIAWNAASPVLHRERWMLNTPIIRERAALLIAQLGIRCQGADQPVGQLSGGNQQKALIAKCLACHPKVLILDEPTRGVDVTARRDIYAIVDDLAEQGVAVLVISSDFEEIARLCDRALVMRQGQVVRALDGGQITPDGLAQASFGQLRDTA
ncbi:autoinducer 2 ABC transporter ATP-binding protein LsrA [Deinococcus sp.]|uniref:autoinducer 2 ABC transporter ATP-binding protein LsrA n=1 Tax=Deinococcus sp. TaxID=47478 RepID=UPI003B593667